ncbi:MAG TPA: ion channel [Blastocatellia bacterium]|nr:ion channel [Blastocatellia bacterium]
MSAEVASETIEQPVAAEEEVKDLGFGAVVAQKSRQRFVNRDGSFNVRRTGLAFWPSLSPYHLLLTVSWGKFLSLMTLYFILINGAFALAYLACGEGALSGPAEDPHNRFWQAFFFSVHTFATIGYGNIAPIGMAANLIVVFESLSGLLATAIITGLIFARFSRPTARIVFSNQAVIAPYKDTTAFMFRITNARKTQLIMVEAKVNLSLYEGGNGPTNRRFHQLKLERSRVDVFPLSWTIVHPIDEDSPLYGYTPERLKQADAEFVILLTAIDETSEQMVHTRSSYKCGELEWNAKFSNIYEPIAENEPITIDVGRLHDIEKV